jgi:endonuclease YncB( thermonuclease family)
MRSHRLLLLLFLAADAYLAVAVLSWRDGMLSPPQGAVRPRRHVPAMRDPEAPETTASIPREQAEAPAPPPAERHQFHRVIVADGGRLRVGDATIRLHGISAPERGRTCRRASGETWPCGNRAAAALRSVIRSRAVDCDVTSRPGLDPVGRCRVGNIDLSEWMVRQGWAEIREGDEAGYADGLGAAKAQGLGLWTSRPPR